MKKVFTCLIILSSCMVCAAQNVGIGTTTPTLAKLHVQGMVGNTVAIFNDSVTLQGISLAADWPGIFFNAYWNGGVKSMSASGYPSFINSEQSNGDISFNLSNVAITAANTLVTVPERMRITSTGKVGIGTSTPGFPLNFASTLGDKISLYGNSGNHYGFGIQSGLLQIHTDAAASNIAFGYGSSGSFTERMRILNNTGYDGMSLNGRLILKNGSADLVGGGAGVWLYKADNTALLGFMGTQNNQNIGFYGGPGGWGFTYDAINSRVGIGNNSPNAPLAFAPTLGKKITLYPGTLGDAGLGMAGNRLQIYSDNPNADVAIGYDAAGTFNERFAVKPNGALAVNGSTGNAGQLLQSNGNGNAAVWSSFGSILPLINTSGETPIIETNNTTAIFTGSSTMNITVTQNTKVLIFCDVMIVKNCTIGPCQSACDFEVIVDNAFPAAATITLMGTSWPSRYGENKTAGPFIVDLTPGSHTISYRGFVSIGAPLWMILKATALLIKQ